MAKAEKKLRKYRVPAVAGAVILLFILFLSGAASAEESDILLFIVGGDLETERASATRDLQEIIRSSRDYPGLSCAAFLCGSETWGLPGLENGHTYVIRISGGAFEVLRDCGGCAGTTSEDLADFLKYGKNGGSLIFWGHGGPGTSGIGVNLLFDGDMLTLPEISSALKKSEKHFCVIGFDACRMASLQSAWVTSPYCDIFCASAEDEDIGGWHYRSVIPVLAEEAERTMENLRGAFRENGITVINTPQLLSCKDQLCRALNGARSGDAALLSELFPLGGDLLLANWENGELPTEDLMPGLGDAYRAFLTRK